MKKITLLVILVIFSCFAFATEYTANNSAELAGYLTSTIDGDVINLAAGTYYPPEVSMDFADYWMDPSPTEGEGSVYSVTFNAFVVPEKDITISGASTASVIFDRNSVDDNDWQMAFVFFSDGDDTDGTGITFENFTVQNLDYGLVNSWALTTNYITSPDCSYMEYTRFNHINFNDIAESAIIIEPRFHNSFGSKGSNNIDLFSRTNYDWRCLTDAGNFTAGYAEIDTRCEIYNCNFNIGGVNPKADNFNKAMVSDTGVMVDLNACQFTSGWRGFHMYGGSSGVFTNTMLISDCSFMDFDGAAYPGITANDNPSSDPEYIYNDEYYNGRGFGAYYQASTFSAEFYGNYYEASNGSSSVYTDGLDSESSSYETFNYIGSPGWVKDLHNIKTQITVENSTFYIFDEGLGIIITKHGDTGRTASNTLNPYDDEYYTYTCSYGTLNQPVIINNCNFYGVNANPTYPGNGCGIFLADWEHYDRDGWGITDTGRQSEIAMRIDGCLFQGFYAGIFVDAGRPDNVYLPFYSSSSKWVSHDDGRIQLHVENSKFVDCDYSLDFSYWDQWVRTNSWILLENNYYGADVDPYTTFNFADNFPAEDSFYEIDNSAQRNADGSIVSYTYGEGATQRSYPGESPTDDNYHVYQPQFLQYLPYYRDFAMTQLCGVEVENLVITRDGTDYILNWDDNINPNAKYAVYAADDPYTADWGEVVATVESSTYTYDGTGLTEMYFKVALVIPNMTDEFYGTNVHHATFGESIPTYTEPIDFGFDIVVNSGVSDYGILDFEYADDAAYTVQKAGFMKQTLDYTGTHYNFISLPFEGEYDTVAELAAYLGLNTNDAISAWNEATQGWQSASYGGIWEESYVPVINQPYMVTAGSAHDIYMMGAIPASPTYNLITTATTDLNFIMIPLDCELTTAAALGAQMGHNNAVMISQWDAANQSWQSCVYLETFSAWINSFSINPGMPIVIGAEQNFTWPQ